ncbi:MAG: hypothetical protein LAD29_05910 [Rhodoferax sp.]|jgi:hypothetical protein|nr:hypothetical protein [Rhodoferax sp.]
MQIMKNLGCLTLTLAALIAPALASDDLETSQMVDQARHWQKKRRDDLAAELWRKVLRFNPKHPEALAKLGAIEARASNLPPPPPPPPVVATKQRPSTPAKLPTSAPSRSKATAPGTTITSDPNMNFSGSLELAPVKPKP